MRVSVCVHLKAKSQIYTMFDKILCTRYLYKNILYINYSTAACCRYVLESHTVYIDFE